MQTLKQQRASSRNWAKLRIIGMLPNLGQLSPITDREKALIDEIVDISKEILDTWDTSSESLGMTIKQNKNAGIQSRLL